jgi:hypothetical protein
LTFDILHIPHFTNRVTYSVISNERAMVWVCYYDRRNAYVFICDTDIP